MDKEDKPDLLQSTRRPFKSRDLALSREVNRQGQRNLAITIQYTYILNFRRNPTVPEFAVKWVKI